MKDISYSVVIRTLGTAGKKYRRLLDSIAALDPPPKETIVVLPEGYQPPPERLGCEKFFFSQKGMVTQRMAGINHCTTDYALLCDDDVCFSPDFVEKLYEPIRRGLGSFSAGPLYSFLPQGVLRSIKSTITGGAAPTLFHRDRYVTVLNTTGYAYNRHLNQKRKYYESQSLAGTCFFADVKEMESLDMLSEYWVDEHGYAALEDQVLFYKAWLRGKKAIVVADAVYQHMDAQTSTRNNKPTVLYSSRFNRVVFWKRFLYEQKKSALGRLWAAVCFGYRLLWIGIDTAVLIARRRMTMEDWHTTRQGGKDARRFLKSREYKNLPPVCEALSQ